MKCDEVHARLIDALVTQRAPSDAALLAHLESCASCRGAWVDYEAMWRQLGDLPAARPSPDARERFERRLAAARLNPTHRTGRPTLSWYIGAAAAAVLVAALTGYEAGLHRSAQQVGPVATEVSMGEPTFILLLHEDSLYRRGEPRIPRSEMVKEYARWADGLERAGTLISDAALARDSANWLGPAHAPSALGDQVDGFFVIRAKDRAAAEQVAATCPHLRHGGRVEVRMIERT